MIGPGPVGTAKFELCYDHISFDYATEIAMEGNRKFVIVCVDWTHPGHIEYRNGNWYRVWMSGSYSLIMDFPIEWVTQKEWRVYSYGRFSEKS